ncbi:hypothetical protein QF002_006826 [Paraburkholderia youngii]
MTVHPDGTGTVKKHYCLGRISHELIQVMPDKRTVLMGDDATNGGLKKSQPNRRLSGNDIPGGDSSILGVCAGCRLQTTPISPGPE